MNTKFSEWIDDPRAVTLMVTVLISIALWVATWSVMGRMDMGAMGMGMEMPASPAPMGDAMESGGMSGTMESGAMNSGAMGGTMGSGATGGAMESGAMQGSMNSGGMAGMMPGMDAADWSARTIFETTLMWLLMMAAMMLPAMAPVMAIYSSVAAKEDRGARLALRIALFTLGYFVLWAVFSVVLALVQLGLRGSDLFTMGGTQATPLAAAGLMIAAGLYQLSPIKDACLRHCRHPLMYLMTHWREGVAGAFRVGANHGVYCVGCCGVFMGLMFVFGAMNVWWMAVIALYFLAEKIAPEAERWGRWIGYGLTLGGIGVMIYQAS
ncbi:DUF2182 domain-containing protein [Rhodobacteraceae bacterium NNCM2]|nr:DUF2182 domain-containing protein [Coraliihabitans acroporae]